MTVSMSLTFTVNTLFVDSDHLSIILNRISCRAGSKNTFLKRRIYYLKIVSVFQLTILEYLVVHGFLLSLFNDCSYKIFLAKPIYLKSVKVLNYI